MAGVCLSCLKAGSIALLAGVSLFAATLSGADSNKIQSDVSFTNAEITLLGSFGPWPVSVPEDPGNEFSGLPWAEELGERLFSDTDLSGAGDLACITCHQPDKGFADGLPVGEGVDKHVRNTQGLFNVGLQRWFGWDGGADSLWAAAIRPVLSEIEMNADTDVLAETFRNKPYVAEALQHSVAAIDLAGMDDEAFVVLLVKAIAAYTRTLVSAPTEFDRFRTTLVNASGQTDAIKQAVGIYSASAARGLKLFLGDANCHVCHFGPDFSNGEFHDTGRPFFTGVGQVDPGRYTGIQRVRKDRYNLLGAFNEADQESAKRKTRTITIGQVNFGQWRTPSLRNLRQTAPYMHDGSLATLQEVVDAYVNIDPQRLHSQGESILKPLDFDDRDREDLVRFLESLSTSDN